MKNNYLPRLFNLSFFLFFLLSGLVSQSENLNVLDMGAKPDGQV